MKQRILAIIALAVATAGTRPATAQTFTVLHDFQNFDGSHPEGALIQDANGTLYGTTLEGGDDFEGTVFKLGKLGKETVLHSFGLTDGEFVASNLVFDKAGNLYGTTTAGGPGGSGVLFRVSRDGSDFQIVHAFQGGQDSVAAVPSGGVVLDSLGNFFGAAELGGAGFGSIYEADSAGDLRVIHTFDGKEGADPLGPLVRDAAGNIFGVTRTGGTHNKGTVFQLVDGTLTVLHSFGGRDGISPAGGLLRDAAGNLYGSASAGGDSGKGTLFEITKAGVFRRLYSFTGGNDGATPNGGLVRDAAGNLYGTAQLGGGDSLGTVFQLTPSHALVVLHSFLGNRDGAIPSAGLLRDSAGNLYGTAIRNFHPPLQDGAIFKIAF